MPAGFIHLKVVFVLLAVVTVVLGSFFAQRVYYRFRTKGEESVDTMNLRISDWLTLCGTLFFAWLCFGAFQAWVNHADWLDARSGGIAQTIEVGNVDEKGTTTLLVYRGSETIAEMREKIHIGDAAEFTIDVTLVRYSDLLHSFGQSDVLQIGKMDLDGPVADERDRAWPFIQRKQTIRVYSPKGLKRGDVLEIVINERGGIEARLRE